MDQVDPIAERQELVTTFSVGLASYTILLWDHLLTLPDEVRYIWPDVRAFWKFRRVTTKGIMTFLFLLNRYLTPFAFILNLFAYFSGKFTPEICEHFVKYEGATTTIGINIAALMMLLRVKALYERDHKAIVVMVAILFIVELTVNAWLLKYGHAVTHSHGVNACTMVFRRPGGVASASAWLPLLYDTVVLLLTVWKTSGTAYMLFKMRKTTAIIGRKASSLTGIATVLLQEGILYYSVIFCVTLILTLMIAFAPQGIQNVAAQTEYLMNVAMISRITLHLKEHNDPPTAQQTINSVGLQLSDYPVHPHGRQNVQISIQAHSVVHNDHGSLVQIPIPKKAKPPAWPHATYDAEEEWIEFAPRTQEDISQTRQNAGNLV